MAESASRRLLPLDLLRAAAVFLVMGRHLWGAPWDVPDWMEPLLETWQRGGWAGVDLFFVLSGFLVAGLLFQDQQRHGSFSIGRFYVRRGFKIYPPFFVFLAIGLVARTLTGDTPTVARTVPEMLFLQNYYTGLFDHTWSLAVEEHFYLALPLFLLGVERCFGNKADPYSLLLPLIVLLVIAAFLLRLEQFVHETYNHRTHLQPTHLRYDALLLGVGLALLYHRRRAALDRVVGARPWLFVAVGLATYGLPLLFLPEASVWMYSAGLTVLALGNACLIAGLLYVRLPDWATLRGIGWVGSHSYSIYLWHMMVLAGVTRGNRATGESVPFVALMILYVVGSVVVGSGMALLVEFPVLRLRDRWFPSRSQAGAVRVQPTTIPAAQAA